MKKSFNNNINTSQDKTVLIVANFIGNYKSNNRFNYLLERVMKNKKFENYKIKLISSNFSHIEKKYRIPNSYSDDYVLLNEGNYTKNISFKRFFAHWIFSKNVEKYLLENHITTKPKLIYVGFPTLSLLLKLLNFSKKVNCKLIVDIQDLWPEVFFSNYKYSFLVKIFFYPLFFAWIRFRNYLINSSDYIFSVSNTYLEVIKAKKDKSKAVYIGTELNNFDINLSKNYDHNKIFVITYVGTLGSSYDLDTPLKAFILFNYKYPNSKFMIHGYGPNYLSLKRKYESSSVIFTGSISYEELASKLITYDVAINSFTYSAQQSITNKQADYFAAGLAIVSNQANKEFKDLIIKYNCGLNIENKVKSFFSAYETLLLDNILLDTLKNNSRKLAKDKFNRSSSYKTIINKIYELSIK